MPEDVRSAVVMLDAIARRGSGGIDRERRATRGPRCSSAARTNATAGGAMRVLSAALGVAAEDGVLSLNACLGIRRPRHRPAPAARGPRDP